MAPKKKPDPKTDMRFKAAKEIRDTYMTTAVDFGKVLAKEIKKANIKGASSWKKAFLSEAQATNKLVQDDWEKIQKAGLADMATEYQETLQGAQQGVIDSVELASISKKFQDALDNAGIDEIGGRVESSLGNLQLEEMRKNFEDSVKGAIDGAFGMIPSNAFTKAIGLDFAADAISKKLAESLLETDKAKENFKKFTDWMGANMGKAVIGGLIIGGLISLIKGISAITDEIGSSFGAIGNTVDGVYGSMAGVRAEAIGFGYSADEAYGAVKGLTESLGMGNIEAAAAAEHTMDLAKSMGMTLDEAGALTGILMVNQNLSAKEAKDFAKTAGALAQASDVAPGDVLRDMADSSEDMAKYTKGTGENMVRAAIQARKMGVSLDDLASTAGGLLDFESSLTAEMEASVMLGRDLNLQRARQLALEGDLAGMGAEILEQVGGVAEWNEMDVLQRQALADSVGMQVDQMSKLVNLAEDGGDAIGDMADQDISEIIPAETMSAITQMQNMLKGLAADVLGKLATAINKIDFSEMVESLKAMLPSQDQINKFAEDLPGHIDKGIKILKNLPQIIENIAIAFVGIKLAVWAVNLAMAANPVGAIIVGVMALVAVIVLIVKNWDWVWEKIKQSFSIVVESIIKPFKDAWNTITGLFSGDIGILDAVKGIGGALLDYITWPWRTALNVIGNLFGFENIGDKLMDGIKGIGGAILDAIIWPFRAGIDMIGNLFGIENIGNKLLDGIKSAAAQIFDFITAPFNKAMDWISSWWGGESPSKLGESIVVGVKSVGPDLQSSLEKPFDDADTAVTTTTVGGTPTKDNTSQMLTALVEQNRLLTKMLVEGIPVRKAGVA